jgi:predicted nucleotidyltransferase
MPQISSSSVKIFYPKHNREQIIEAIQGAIPKLQEQLSLKLVALFGSYAKGNYTVASDIDLLIVYNGRERQDAYALCKRTLRIPRLEPHVYAEGEYGEMKPTIDRMIKDGVVLFDHLEQ